MLGIRGRQWALILGSGAYLIILATVISAVAASNTVSPSRADQDQIGVTANDLKPEACSGIDLTNIVDIGAGESSTPGNDLILGTAGDDSSIRGGEGDDCILGGGGDDRIRILFFIFPGLYGEEGNDVLIGGPGSDACAGGGGTDTLLECEVEW